MAYQFTVISPMYNVERYLLDFLASLERQTYGIDRIQIVLVDDGSTDATLALAEGFAAGRSNVTVLTKPNGGQASARNLGLSVAAGAWLTFPDPDDVLVDDYFAKVAAAIARPDAQDAAVISTRLLMWFEQRDEIVDSHALTRRFRAGLRVVDLDQDPEWIQPHVTAGFIRTAVVKSAEIAFPEDLRLRFEDGNFISRYLLHCAKPIVVFVPEAEYHYRQRADSSSTIQSSAANPLKYTDTIRVGFRGVIAEAAALGRPVPRWTQNLFLYDQFWILRSSQTGAVRQAVYPDAMYDELATLVPEFLRHVDDEAILGFNLMPVAPWMREALLLVKRGGGHSDVYRPVVDARRGLTALVYRYVGEQPAERVHAGGVEIEPRFAKTHELEYVGRPIALQRTLWVPDDADIVLELDGQPLSDFAAEPVHPAEAFAVASLSNLRDAVATGRIVKAIKRRLTGQLIPLLRRDLAVRSKRLAQRFAHAWVFIDRDVDANDSAEDLYWWMVANHPEVNAWFVVRKGTKDWERLQQRGARVVAYGTPAFFALLMHADHLASSHADRFITDALPQKFRPADQVFTFLQHGVIKGDLSLWLNPKKIDVFITSTPDEYTYISGRSPYRFGAKEVRLAGLPRFDALAERAALVHDDDRDVILVMPTWRDFLLGAMAGASDERSLRDDFESTTYARSIQEFLGSDTLAQAAREHGARIVFMPHPNMKQYLPRLRVPAHVDVLSYADADVRDLLAHARLLVTDYSSTAFNAAYLEVPVVYFQFDREEYFASHTERLGYFDYATHGFGPVTLSADDAAAVVAGILAHGPAEEHAERARRTFPRRDGRNSERVYDAMVEAATRRSLAERSVSAPADTALAQGD